MNKTEQMAYNWLLKKGVKKEDIKYQHTTSPDFITSEGSFEVKKTNTFNIFFTKKQMPLLKDQRITFLIYYKDEQEPLVYDTFEMQQNFKINISYPLIATFSLEKITITRLEKMSTAFGKTRSEFLDVLVAGFYTPEIEAKIEQILKLQNKVTTSSTTKGEKQ